MFTDKNNLSYTIAEHNMRGPLVLLSRAVLSVFLFSALTMSAFATPSLDNYVSVTNDWYNANYSNVYELAQSRLLINSNDAVSAYLMLDWSTSFGCLAEISNCVEKVITVSDSITNAMFSVKYRILRPSYLSYRDEFLPTLTDADVESEKTKSYLPNKTMPSGYMLQLLDEAGLW